MKHRTLDIAVREDVDVAIRNTRLENIEREQQFLTKNQLRAGFIVRGMLGKRLCSYFVKWRRETGHFTYTCKTKIAVKLIKIYKSY